MTHQTGNALLDGAAATIDGRAANAMAAAQRGVDAVRDGSHRLMERAQGVSDRAIGHVHAAPVKSLLLAATAGAVLMGLLSLLSRSRDGD